LDGRSIREDFLTFSIPGGDMKRVTFLLALAVGLAASLTISAEVRAGSTLVSVDVQLNPLPDTAAITGLTVSFTGAGSFTGLELVTPGPSTGAAIFAAGDTVTVSISSAIASAYHAFGAAFVDFNFTVSGDVNPTNPNVTSLSAMWLGNGSFVAASSTTVSFSPGNGPPPISPQAIPEPAGLSLLGIGMISLVTYRRFFKRVRSLS